QVKVNGRFGCINLDSKWIPLPGKAVLWEEDCCSADKHDLLEEVNLDGQGRFHLESWEREFTESPRFFIAFWVNCEDQNKCADPIIRER
ncbi:hypothetical protein PFISCL1PPCAC_17639, partial [Pristionchus fissidentatus]